MGRSNIGSLLAGFGSSYELTGRVLRDSEIARVAQAAPTEIPDPADPAARKVAFLGKTYDSTPDQVTMDRGRQLAMAGVLDKFGEVQRGSELRQSVRRDEIADQALAMQRQRFEWEQRDQAERSEQQRQDREYQAAQKAMFKNSTIGRRSQAYAESMRKYSADKAAYDAAIAAGDRNAVEPTPPAVTAPTVAESMLFSAEMLATDAAHGKADPNAFLKLAETAKQVQAEGYIKSLKLAQSGAPLTQVLSQFNADGQTKIDPSSVVSDKMVPRGGGVQSRVIVLKGQDGKSQVIDTLAELDALDKADKLFTRAYQANADARGASADARGWAAEGRHQAEFNAGAGERAGKSAIGAMQVELMSPKTTPERAAEIRNRLASLKVATSGGGEQPAVVKLAESALQSGMFSSMRDALQWANGTKDATPERLRAEFYGKAISSGMSPQRARAAADAGMQYMFPDQAPAAVQRGSAVPPPEQRKIGGTYMTPKGAMTWRGNGWEPAAR